MDNEFLSPRGSTATSTMLWRNSWSITGRTHGKLTSLLKLHDLLKMDFDWGSECDACLPFYEITSWHNHLHHSWSSCVLQSRGRDVSRKTKTVSTNDPNWLVGGWSFFQWTVSVSGRCTWLSYNSFFFITVEFKRYKIAIRCSRWRNPRPKPILTLSYCVWSRPKSRSRGHMTKGNDKDECDRKQVSTQTQIYFLWFSVDC